MPQPSARPLAPLLLLLLAIPGAAHAVSHPDPEGLFALADGNSDGAVTRGELRRLRRAFAGGLDRKAAVAAWKASDTDRTGWLSPAEFAGMVTRNVAPSAEARAVRDTQGADGLALLDDDGSGTVRADELSGLVAVVAFDLSRDKLDRLVALFDRNGDAALDPAELGAFLHASNVRRTAHPDDLARRPPHPIDLDGDGRVAPGELSLAADALGIRVGPNEYAALRKAADRDGDGNLSTAELLSHRL